MRYFLLGLSGLILAIGMTANLLYGTDPRWTFCIAIWCLVLSWLLSYRSILYSGGSNAGHDFGMGEPTDEAEEANEQHRQ